MPRPDLNCRARGMRMQWVKSLNENVSYMQASHSHRPIQFIPG
jgi:hypothetical protein